MHLIHPAYALIPRRYRSCAFIDDIFGALSKGAGNINQILGVIGQVLGLLNLVMGVIGYIATSTDDFSRLGKFSRSNCKNPTIPIAGLLDGLMSDPCLKHLIQQALLVLVYYRR